MGAIKDGKQHYLVRWETDEWADSPEEAAQRARQVQLNPDTWATVFEIAPAGQVKPTNGLPWITIDLDEREYHGN